ncbi:MAG: phosphoribosylamine--glycine ligase [Actinomycetaceae bacterium]|nr:phosphoribosylamine--glycine ligase [Actinomycetaceae bacterium]
MKILLLGSGGREHALALAIVRDPKVTALLTAPGNPGTASLGRNVNIDPTDSLAVVALAKEIGADLVVIGPEAPLVAGVADALRAANIPCFGPSKAAAQLEGSKAFAKEIMQAAGVDTAQSKACRTIEEAEAALDLFGAPHVVKQDGLAAGKGVVVTNDRQEALDHAQACIDAANAMQSSRTRATQSQAQPSVKLGESAPASPSSATPSPANAAAQDAPALVIEEYLDGPEASVFCISDGKTVLALPAAQDFKRIGEGGTGPNTGGMGAYSPLPWAPSDLEDQVITKVAQPVIDEMARRGTPFVGVLYCGLALTSKGMRVIEFNVRFGDPETQSVVDRVTSSLPALLYAAATGTLDTSPAPTIAEAASVTVVLAAPGYPGTISTGGVIQGVGDAEYTEDVHIIHAGTAIAEDGSLVASGGRVLAAVASGENIEAARAKAYTALEKIQLESGYYRRDIAADISQIRI